MAFLIREIIWFLLLTAVLWGAIGWWLRSISHRSAMQAMEQDYEARMQRLLRSRDDYRDQLEQVAATNASGNLSTTQRSQIAAHIGKLEQEARDEREQAARLREKLEAVANTAKARDEEYRRLRERLEQVTATLAQREQELAQRQPAQEQNESEPEAPAQDTTAQQLRDYKHSIARLNARIESLSRRQEEPMATLEHTRLLDVIQAQKKTIAGMTRRLQEAAATDGQSAERADTDAIDEEQSARLRAELAELRDRDRAQSETIATLRERGADTATGDSELAQLRQSLQEQERTIVTLKEQLRQSVSPAPSGPRSGSARSAQPSGDLFATPPAVLMDAPRGEPDDLQKIHGVGPVLEAKLNELGIYHFRQIAALSETDIGWIASKMNAFPNRILRDRWVSQAAALADGGGAQVPVDG